MAKLPQLEFPAPKRSNYDLSFKNRFTAMPGAVYPVAFYRTLPGEHFEISLSNLVKTVSAKAPLMGRFQVRFDFFHVPDRLYINDFRDNDVSNVDKLLGTPYPTLMIAANNVANADQSQTAPKDSTRVVNENSLMNFLGLPAGFYNAIVPNKTIYISAMRLLYYLDIFRNYYINPQEIKFPYMQGGSVKFMTVSSLNGLFDSVINDVNRGIPINHPDFDAVSSDLLSYFETWNTAGDGFLLSCYRPDYLSNWISNTAYKSIQTAAKINVVDGAFTIDQLRLGNKLAKLYERAAISGTRYGEFIRALFGVNTDRNLDIPEFLGSTTTTLTFDDVVATSNSSTGFNQNVGDVGGRGVSWNSGRKHYINTTEYGCICVMCRIIPMPDYFEGVDKFLVKTKFTDEFNPSLDRLGFQPIFDGEFVGYPYPHGAGGTTPNIAWGEDWPMAYGSVYQPAWLEYTTKLNELHGDFVKDMRYWTLGRTFVHRSSSEETPSFMFSNSAYIMPGDFTYPFTDTSDSARNFMVQVSFDTFAKRIISKRLMPNLG